MVKPADRDPVAEEAAFAGDVVVVPYVDIAAVGCASAAVTDAVVAEAGSWVSSHQSVDSVLGSEAEKSFAVVSDTAVAEVARYAAGSHTVAACTVPFAARTDQNGHHILGTVADLIAVFWESPSGLFAVPLVEVVGPGNWSSPAGQAIAAGRSLDCSW